MCNSALIPFFCFMIILCKNRFFVFNKSPVEGAPPPVTIRKSSRVILDAGDLHSSIFVPHLGNLSLPSFLPFNKSTMFSLSYQAATTHSAQAAPQHGHIHLATPWRREREWTEHRMTDASQCGGGPRLAVSPWC